MTKKKRAPKRNQVAAAARKNTNNETTPAADSKENTPAIVAEKGATVMFAQPKSVSPKIATRIVHDFDDKNTEDSTQYPLPTEICSSVSARRPQGTSPADELMLQLMYLNCIYKRMKARGFVVHEPCDLDMVAVECSNSNNAVVIDGDVAEDQRAFTHKEDHVVEHQGSVTTNNVVVLENQKYTMPIEVNAEEKYQEVTLAQNQKATISEEFNDIENNTLEAFELGKKFVAVHDNEETEFVAVHDNEEALTTTKPTADSLYRTHDAVSTQVVTPEVRKQLQTIKDILEDVLNRVNAKGA